MEDLIGSHRPIRVWRETLLDVGNAESTAALDDACQMWIDSAQSQHCRLLDGEPIQVEPFGFADLTYLLATVCDLGPSTIDPSPLTEFLWVVQEMRVRGRNKHSGAYREAYDDELQAMGLALRSAMQVLQRLVFAWVAKENREPRAPAEPPQPARKPGSKMLARIKLIAQGKSNAEIAAETGATHASIDTARTHWKNGVFILPTELQYDAAADD